jgi:hypothetical protein
LSRDVRTRLRLVAGAPAASPRRRRGAAAFLALLLAACACASRPPAPDHQGIPGTRVRLVVPDGFAVAERFPGLLSEDGVSLVTVTEVPGPVEKMRAGMTKEALATREMQLLRSEEVSVDDREGLLVHALQEAAPGTDLRRWILVFGAADGSVMIAASTPQVFEDRLGETLRGTLISAKWNPAEILDPYAGLGFTVAEVGELKISDRLPRMISFTLEGHRGAIAPEDPLFLAGSSFAPLAVTDLEDFAHRRLGEIAEFRELKILSERSLTLSGLPAHELVAAARDRRTAAPLRFYQALVVDGDHYFLLQGMVGVETAKEFIPQFREIAHSFRRTP